MKIKRNNSLENVIRLEDLKLSFEDQSINSNEEMNIKKKREEDEVTTTSQETLTNRGKLLNQKGHDKYLIGQRKYNNNKSIFIQSNNHSSFIQQNRQKKASNQFVNIYTINGPNESQISDLQNNQDNYSVQLQNKVDEQELSNFSEGVGENKQSNQYQQRYNSFQLIQNKNNYASSYGIQKISDGDCSEIQEEDQTNKKIDKKSSFQKEQLETYEQYQYYQDSEITEFSGAQGTISDKVYKSNKIQNKLKLKKIKDNQKINQDQDNSSTMQENPALDNSSITEVNLDIAFKIDCKPKNQSANRIPFEINTDFNAKDLFKQELDRINSSEQLRYNNQLNKSSFQSKEFENYLKIQDDEENQDQKQHSLLLNQQQSIELIRLESLNNSTLDSKNSLQKLNNEDPQYLADLNLFMVSSKEKSEDELARIETRLNDVIQNISNVQTQIQQLISKKEDSLKNNMYFQNLLSLLNHMMEEHKYLIQRHKKVRKDIQKLKKYQINQEKKRLEKEKEEERFRKFYQQKAQKLNVQRSFRINKKQDLK